MTENSENQLTPQNSLQEAFAPLLATLAHPWAKSIIELVYQDKAPTIDRSGTNIIITGLPDTLTRDVIDNSPIMDICHRMKHLYSDGDRIGKRGIERKRQRGDRLENNSLRMCIVYTCVLRKTEDDGSTQLVLNFMPSHTKHHYPMYLERFKIAETSATKLNEIHTSELYEIVSENQHYIKAKRRMTEAEIQIHMDVFINTCYEEIRDYLHQLNQPSDAILPTYIEATC